MRIKTAHKKGGSEGIGFMFEVFLLRRYLRSSTGSQEEAGGAGCGSWVGELGSGVQCLAREM
jgi:hypothetical protein